jgi:hypothetical protein
VSGVSDSISRGKWIAYSIPTVIAAGWIVWALVLPRWQCVSGSDNSTCEDYIYLKWTIAGAGIVLALIVVGIMWVVRRINRTRRTR